MSKEINHDYPNYGYEFPLTKASEGYFYAKREVADAIIRRVAALTKELETSTNQMDKRVLTSKIQALEEFRSFVRNVMLWDTRRGK